MKSVTKKLPVVVLISGSGTNLQAIIEAIRDDGLPVEIRAVISNRADAFGLTRAREARIPAEVLDHKAFSGRKAYDAALQDLIDRYEPGLVILAGFMRILSARFVNRYAGRMLNIHPSLLPSYQGLNTHRRVLAAGDLEHGASVHFVTEELDGGPVIVQAPVPVLPGDTDQALAARVQNREYHIYPLAIRWFAEGRLTLQDSHVVLDGHALTEPVRIPYPDAS